MLRTVKTDKFAQQALIKKGYDPQEVIKLSDKEIDELPLSQQLKEYIITYKQRGGKTSEEIAEELADLMMQPVKVDKEQERDIIEDYAIEENIDESNQETYIEPIDGIEPTTNEVSEDKIVIEHKTTNVDMVRKLTEILSTKEYKAQQWYIKLVKESLTKEEIEEIDSSVLNDLIQKRIEEVKNSK